MSAFGEYWGGGWYWIGVTVDNLTYKSNGEPVSVNPIPWASDEPSQTNSTYCMRADSYDQKWYADMSCSVDYGYPLCEADL